MREHDSPSDVPPVVGRHRCLLLVITTFYYRSVGVIMPSAISRSTFLARLRAPRTIFVFYICTLRCPGVALASVDSHGPRNRYQDHRMGLYAAYFHAAVAQGRYRLQLLARVMPESRGLA